jgi:hypothetical protein
VLAFDKNVEHMHDYMLLCIPNEMPFKTKVKSLASSCVKLYEGHKVLELAACGLKLEACCSTLEACRLHLEQLGA